MNEYGNNTYNDDVEIDLVDLIFYFFRKWKVLLVFLLVGIIAGAGLWGVKVIQARDEAATAAAEKAEKAAMTPAEVEEVYEIDEEAIANMEIAYGFRRQYMKQKDYNENSLYMQLDPNGIYYGRLVYYIFAGHETHFISALYNMVIYSDNFYDDIAEASGLDYGGNYIKEVIGFSSTADSTATSTVTISEDTEVADRGIYVTFTARSTDEESCEKMLTAIEEKADMVHNYCDETFGDYSCVKIAKNVQLMANPSDINTQNTYINQMNTYLTNAQKLENAFNEDEMEYYEKIFWNFEEEEDLEEVEVPVEVEEVVEEVEEEVVEVAMPSPVRWLAIGLFGAIMIWGCIYLVKYLMDSSVKTSGEIKDSYNIPMFGRIGVEGNGKKYFVAKLYSRIKGATDTPSYVLSVIETLGKADIALCGNEGTPEVLSVMDSLAKDSDNLSVNEFASKSTEALKNVKEAGCEIMVVKVGKTKRSDIKRELEICNMQNIRVLGMIAVEDC